MELSQAISFFNTVSLSGLNKVASAAAVGAGDSITVDTVLATADDLLNVSLIWVPGVAAVNFMSFDRFITDRSFGQKKRMAELGGPVGIDEQYEVVRTPDNNVYMISAVNRDIVNNQVYGHTYLLQEANYVATIVKFNTANSTYGIVNTKVEVLSASVFCDIERMTAESSREFDTVRYSSHIIFMPGSTDVTTNDEISVMGERYEIVEVNNILNLKEARALKRGSA